jgi:hypothetical protein
MRDITANPEAGLGKVCRVYKDNGVRFLSRLMRIDDRYYYFESKAGIEMRNYRETINQIELIEV